MSKKTWYENLTFGLGAIRKPEWNLISRFINHYECRNVLEIGAGYSTMLFDFLGLNVVTYETDADFIAALHLKVSTRVALRNYKYPQFAESADVFDLAFVDGPGPGINTGGRKASIEFADRRAEYLFIHDGSRAAEKASAREVFGEGWQFHACCLGMTYVQRSDVVVRSLRDALRATLRPAGRQLERHHDRQRRRRRPRTLPLHGLRRTGVPQCELLARHSRRCVQLGDSLRRLPLGRRHRALSGTMEIPASPARKLVDQRSARIPGWHESLCILVSNAVVVC